MLQEVENLKKELEKVVRKFSENNGDVQVSIVIDADREYINGYYQVEVKSRVHLII